jgi:hypothetical protein
MEEPRRFPRSPETFGNSQRLRSGSDTALLGKIGRKPCCPEGHFPIFKRFSDKDDLKIPPSFTAPGRHFSNKFLTDAIGLYLSETAWPISHCPNGKVE